MDKNSINIKILKVKMTDIDLLQNISQQTFIEAFSEANIAANMAKYMAEKFSKETLLAELSNQGSEFYFARLDNRVIGYLKINSEKTQTELQHEHALEIERIYVLQEFHGKKVGQLLYEKALDIAKLKNVGFIWLGVWEENLRAISFYQKNGFVAFDKHIFKLGDDEQTDIMMKKKLDQQLIQKHEVNYYRQYKCCTASDQRSLPKQRQRSTRSNIIARNKNRNSRAN